MRTWFAENEVDSVEILPSPAASPPHDPALVAMVDAATGILITDGSCCVLPPRWAARPLPRRSGAPRAARGGGRGAGRRRALPTHIIVHDTAVEAGPCCTGRWCALPGLNGWSIASRLTVMRRPVRTFAHLPPADRRRLKPFLIGVALDPNTGIVLTPTARQGLRPGNALVVDGWRIEYSSIAEGDNNAALSVTGAQIHNLGRGFTFNPGHAPGRTAAGERDSPGRLRGLPLHSRRSSATYRTKDTSFSKKLGVWLDGTGLPLGNPLLLLADHRRAPPSIVRWPGRAVPAARHSRLAGRHRT